jgi:Arc-like DNA binding dprotein
MADKVVNLNLRLPPQLHAKLVEQARNSKRSLNSEIIGRLSGRLADSSAELPWGEIRPELRGLVKLVATVMDVAGCSRFGVDALYAPDSVPDWIDDPSGYAVAAAAAARALAVLRPQQDAAADAEYAAALAETNRGHGEAVANTILDKVATEAPSDRRTAALRKALGSLVERVPSPLVHPAARDFGPVWVAPMTAEQRARLEAQHAKAREWREWEEPKSSDEGHDEASE